MAMIRSGKMLCDNCGEDCTKLFGMKMEVFDRPYDIALQQKVAAVDKEMGKHNFVFCWMCTAKAFGAKTLLQQKAESEINNGSKTTEINTKPIEITNPQIEVGKAKPDSFEVETNNEIGKLEKEVKKK